MPSCCNLDRSGFNRRCRGGHREIRLAATSHLPSRDSHHPGGVTGIPQQSGRQDGGAALPVQLLKNDTNHVRQP